MACGCIKGVPRAIAYAPVPIHALPKGGFKDMTKRPYEKPALGRLGLLRELTQVSGWGNDQGQNQQ